MMNAKWAKKIRTAYINGKESAEAYGNQEGGVNVCRVKYLQTLKHSNKKTRNLLTHAWEQGLIAGKKERFGWMNLIEMVMLVQQETLNEAAITGRITDNTSKQVQELVE